MTNRAKIDRRGRVQLPAEERKKAEVPTDSEVLVIPKGRGRLELVLVGEEQFKKVHEITRGRLKAWKEEEHKADKLLTEISERK